MEARLEQERQARLDAERVADETIRDLYERQCLIQVLRSVAFAANDARSIEQAMQAGLEAVCRYAGWAVGHVFFVDGSERLVSSDIWYDVQDRFGTLRERTEAVTFERGAGLPGQVVERAVTVWIEDVREVALEPDRGFTDCGIRAAVGVPILVGDQVDAVFELFSEEPRSLEPGFVDLMGQVGTMLGRVIERERAKRELHDANHRLTRALFELQEAQDSIVQQERLRALGQMASGIAHDFNNALHPIVGYAELLVEHPAMMAEPDVQRYLRNILTSASDAASVVARLREFYRKREDEDVLVPIDLRPLVEQVADLTRPRWYNEALARGIRITVVPDLGPIPPIMGHEAQLREALTNLLLNAVDAMPSGGTIVLRTRVNAGRVVVEVCDSGVGMTEEVKKKCLEPFFTTKGNQGSGLGLGMVYGIVNRHDGTLSITSAPGKGTSIALDFPPAEAGAAVTPASRPRALLSPMHVLVVDDKPEAGALLREMLHADGHAVDLVATGFEAVTRLSHQEYDLVVTDRSMPAMSGDELARLVKESPSPVPVIMVTGFGVLMTSANERPFGVDIVLPKPVTRAALRDALATVHPSTRGESAARGQA